MSQERRGEVHEEEGVIECSRESGKQREKGRQTPLEAPGRPGAEDLAHDDPEIRRGGMKLQPLEDILSAPHEDASPRRELALILWSELGPVERTPA